MRKLVFFYLRVIGADLHLVCQPDNDIDQLVCCGGLQDNFIGSRSNCLSASFKLIVTGKQDAFNLAEHLYELNESGICGFTTPLPAAFDLELFRNEEHPIPSTDDYERINHLLAVILSADDSATAAKLDNELKNILGGNKYEKSYALETLGYCGILARKQHAGFTCKFVRYEQMQDRPTLDTEIEPPPAFCEGVTAHANDQCVRFSRRNKFTCPRAVTRNHGCVIDASV